VVTIAGEADFACLGGEGKNRSPKRGLKTRGIGKSPKEKDSVVRLHVPVRERDPKKDQIPEGNRD